MNFDYLSFFIGVGAGVIFVVFVIYYIGYKIQTMNKLNDKAFGPSTQKKVITKYEFLVALRDAERELLKKRELILKDIEFELDKIEAKRKIVAETSGPTITPEQLFGN